jgi:hypothetical protein
MIIVQNKISSFLLGKNYSAMCLSPFILVNRNIDVKNNPELVNHEKIHAHQQLEMLWLFFFLWYLLEYLIRLIACRSHDKAYRNLAHEKEAYQNSNNLEYLKSRKFYAWIKFL